MSKSLNSLGAILICPLLFFACKPSEKGPKYHVEPAIEEDSLGFLDRQIRQEPTDAKNYFNKARFVRGQGDIPTVLELMKAAISLDSNNVDYHLFMSDVFNSTGESDKSLAVMRRCVRIAPESAEAQIKLGEVWAMKGNNDSAFYFINQGLKLDITNAYAYYLKGLIYKRIGNYERSTSSFQTAIEQDANYYDAYLELGLNLLSQDSLLAIQYLSNAVNSSTEPIQALVARAAIYTSLDSLNLALADYQELIRLDSLNANYYAASASVHLKNDAVDNAKKYFEKAVNLNNKLYSAFAAYGYCLELEGEFEEAEAAYKKALTINPEYSLAKEGLLRIKN